MLPSCKGSTDTYTFMAGAALPTNIFMVGAADPGTLFMAGAGPGQLCDWCVRSIYTFVHTIRPHDDAARVCSAASSILHRCGSA
jgi:hypothetical protein